MNFEPELIKYFAHLGFRAEKISESHEESPDFVVSDDVMTFIAELKTKFPSEEEIAQRRRILGEGLFHTVSEQIVRKNTLSGIARHAAEQLSEYGLPESIRLVFLLAVGHLAEARFHQFIAAMYGSTTIVDVEARISRPCFFFYESDFFRHRDILDAAIVSTKTNQTLLLNPYSPKRAQVRESSLFARFGGGIVDPEESEQNGKSYIVLGELDRRDEQAVLEYLREKYSNENLIKIDPSYLTGTVQVPIDENGA